MKLVSSWEWNNSTLCMLKQVSNFHAPSYSCLLRSDPASCKQHHEGHRHNLPVAPCHGVPPIANRLWPHAVLRCGSGGLVREMRNVNYNFQCIAGPLFKNLLCTHLNLYLSPLPCTWHPFVLKVWAWWWSTWTATCPTLEPSTEAPPSSRGRAWSRGASRVGLGLHLPHAH